ncbi:MAG: hypothetical protein H0T46_10950 [Deltaproteobacteria bacterium]|nr:hypothetical protein [Deltaproteobacteria bacterium]
MSPRAVLGVLLVSSLALNVYLVVASDPAASEPSVASTAAPASPPSRPRSLPAPQRSTGTAERPQREQHLAELEARIERLRPLSEVYADQPRSDASERIIAPYLKRVFEAPGVERRTYTTECHGRVCRLDVDRRDNHWIHALQSTYPGRELFDRMSFGPEETYIAIAEPEIGVGYRVADGATRAFSEDPETRRCFRAHPATGTLVIRFELDGRRLAYRMSGDVVGQPVWTCLRYVLERVIPAYPVPEGVTSLPAEPLELTFPITLPEAD